LKLEDYAASGQSLGTLPQDDESGDERSDDSRNGYLNLMMRCLNDGGFSTSGRQRSIDGTDALVGRMSGDERRA